MDVPKEAYRAELIVTDGYGEDHAGRGWSLGNGIWMLGIEQEDDWRSGWFDKGDPCVVRLFDGEGSLLLSREGAMP